MSKNLHQYQNGGLKSSFCLLFLTVFFIASPVLAGPVSRFSLTYENATAVPVQTETSWTHEWIPIVDPGVLPPIPTEIPDPLQQMEIEFSAEVPASTETPAATPPVATSVTEAPAEVPAVVTETTEVPENETVLPELETVVAPPEPAAKTAKTWPMIAAVFAGVLAIALFVLYLIRVRRRQQDEFGLELEEPTSRDRRTWALVATATVSVIIISVVAYRQFNQSVTGDTLTRTDTGKYVIWTGWGAPPLDYLESHPDIVEKFPYDGMLVGAETFQTNPADVTTSMTRSVFSTVSPLPNYSSQMERWSNLTKKTGALKHSLGYIYFKVEGKQPFTDATAWDSQILPRWRQALQYLHSAGINGVFLDTENYDPAFSIWDITPEYNGLKTLGKNNIPLQEAMLDPTFAAAAQPFIDQSNHYGKRMVEIIKEVYGDEPVDLMVSHAGSGLSLFNKIGSNTSWYNDGTGASADKHHELTPSFMDGIVAEAAESNVSFIDGMEYTYSYNDRASGSTSMEKHKSAYDYAHSLDNIKTFSSDPDLYAANLKVSNAIWLDYGQSNPWYYQNKAGEWWNKQVDPATNQWFQTSAPGHTEDENYYSPQKFTSALRASLAYSDKYAWVYSEKPDVFGRYDGVPIRNGFTLDVPLGPAYGDSVTSARQSRSVGAPTCQPSLATPPKIMEGHLTVLPPQATVTDLSGYTVIQMNPTLPVGATVAASGNIHWTPTANQVGMQTFTWRFSNGFAVGSCETTVEVEASRPVVTLDVVSDRNQLSDNEAITYTLKVTNGGTDVAQKAKITATMPERWTLVSATAPAVATGNLVEIDLTTIELGATREIQLVLMPAR